MKGTGEQNNFGEHRKSTDFDLGEQGKMPIFFSGDPGNRYPSPNPDWEGLVKNYNHNQFIETASSIPLDTG